MKVGIIGSGRMGIDLFFLILNYQCDVILICTDLDKMEPIRKKTERLIKRYKKADHAHQIQVYPNFVTQDYQALQDCDMVIEAIIEDLNTKQALFKKIENIVSQNCILATNSSSLDRSEVFQMITNKQRCIGMHFFYPLKLSTTVEINIARDTSPQVIERTASFLRSMEKTPLILSGGSRLLLSKLLISIAAYSYNLSLENQLTIAQINTITKEQLMLFGIFELVDSTGFYIITQCLTNLQDQLHEQLYQPLFHQLSMLMKKGHNGRTENGLLDIDQSSDLKRDGHLYQSYLLRLQVFLLNEIARYFVADKGLDIYHTGACIKDVLGLSMHPIELYQSLGNEVILNVLEDEYNHTRSELMKAADFSVFL